MTKATNQNFNINTRYAISKATDAVNTWKAGLEKAKTEGWPEADVAFCEKSVAMCEENLAKLKEDIKNNWTMWN